MGTPASTMKVPALLLLLVAGTLGQSCKDRCDESYDPSKPCQCNNECGSHNNCCSDYVDVCLSCKDRCGESYDHAKPCQCNNECGSHGNCCDDYDDECGGGTGGI